MNRHKTISEDEHASNHSFFESMKLLPYLYRINRMQFCYLAEEVGDFGLHAGQVQMLVFLGHHEGLSQTELAQKLRLKPPTVAIMLRRLEHAGFIVREQQEHDRRIQTVHLSEQAKKLTGKLESISRKIEQSMLSGFSEEETQALTSYLERITANLRKEHSHE